MTSTHRRTVAEIDLSALIENFQGLRKLIPEESFFCPMVKANAYGHGDVEVARSLEANGAEQIGVALVEEAVKLRDAGLKIPIMVFGIFESFSVEAIFRNGLTPVVSDWSQLKLLANQKTPIALHVKFNTGMSRLGFKPTEAAKVREWLDAHPHLRLDGVATHLFHGDDAGLPGGDSEAQLTCFEKAVAAFRGKKIRVHALNSSAAVNLSARREKKLEMGQGQSMNLGFRPGIALYGGVPSSGQKISLRLKPVMTFKSHIVQTHQLKSGERVSYNGIWVAKRDSRIGVIPLGYGDGFARVHTNNADVLCRGKRVPVVGTVCMDYFMVDLTRVVRSSDDELRGEEIVLIGAQGTERITAEELAKKSSTISYEVFTRISERVPRVYLR